MHHRRWTPYLAILGLAVLGFVLASCGTDEVNPWGLGGAGKGESQDTLSVQEHEEMTAFLAGQSSDGDNAQSMSCEFKDVDVPVWPADMPAQNFDFCVNPTRGSATTKANLTNAAWLAYFSAMEYGHLAVINPHFMSLGFGNENDATWTDRAIGLRHLRRLECVQKERSNCNDEQIVEASTCRGSCLPDTLSSGEQLIAVANDPQGQCVQRRGHEQWNLNEVANWVDEQVAKKGAISTADISARYQESLIAKPNHDNLIKYFSGETFEIKRTDSGERLKVFENGSTQMVWAEHRDKNIVIVAFRGTEPTKIKDIVADINFFKTPLTEEKMSADWGAIHSGFLNAYKAVGGYVARVLKELKERGDGGPKIWVTGHSLGGALATLFTANLLNLNESRRLSGKPRFNLMGLYTFGSPRVGNAAFQQMMHKMARAQDVALIRVKNRKDIVTRIPKLKYDHVGQVIRFPDLDPKEIEGGVKPILIGPKDDPEEDDDDAWIGSASDHSMQKYFARIKEALAWAAKNDPALVACDY